MKLDAIFEFIADNPVTALVMGGILFLLIGGLLLVGQIGGAWYFEAFGGLLLLVGIALWFHERQ